MENQIHIFQHRDSHGIPIQKVNTRMEIIRKHFNPLHMACDNISGIAIEYLPGILIYTVGDRNIFRKVKSYSATRVPVPRLKMTGTLK